MQTTQAGHEEPAVEHLELVTVLAALSDPGRLAVVRELAACDERTCGTFGHWNSKATRSHHLRILREAGITRTRAESTSRYVSLRRDDLEARFPGLLEAVLLSVDVQE
jgi:DNA-binding transcriptional ArsR family regulator